MTSGFERLRRDGASSLSEALARLTPREAWLLAALALVFLALQDAKRALGEA